MSSASTESGDGGGVSLSLVAQFDDINRLNNVLNDAYSEECFLAFAKQMEWCRVQWAGAEAEASRLRAELDEALRSLAKWEGKFAHVRKLLDAEKMQRKHAVRKYEELDKQMVMARDLLFNDNRNKLNNETLQKLAFLNGTTAGAHEHNTKLTNIPELNSTGTVLSEMSYSRSEDDLDISLTSTRRSWLMHNRSHRLDLPAPKKRRSSGASSATKMVELEGGKVLATATTTLTLQRAPANHDLKPPLSFKPISESSDEAPPLQRSPVHPKQVLQVAVTPGATFTNGAAPYTPGAAPYTPGAQFTPTAPPRTDTDGTSDSTQGPERRPSVRACAGDVWAGSPRARPRQHNLVAKNFYRHETCAPCGKRIKFAKMGVRCETCRAQAHAECRNLLPLPCVPPGPTARGANIAGSIADFAPRTPPMVPALLVHCINEVEKRGLAEKGIYRLSGADKDIKRLKERFLRGCGAPPLGSEDVHVLCGCIKDFLRSLREPLVTNSLWSDFMDAAKVSEASDATAAVVQAVSQLPPPNRDTLAFLMLHLQKVAESPDCQMGIDNLAKVFGPTVVGYAYTEPSEMYTATTQLVAVMTLLLKLPGEYWARWACVGDLLSVSSAETPPPAPPPPAATLGRTSTKPRGYFYSPADTGVSRKKKNYFQ